ncbi:MAG: AEC family transporter [Desulfovibrio sp.]|uniref:AEC family transporter n=1 Tax=Desulfovibrio sp. TaxID=885 RepID=UPI001A7D4D56|nr:AEC family transporter [Desulfovibrio sp.]MBD5417462.1 AEC family transporter [Desulfovibrio sp.]
MVLLQAFGGVLSLLLVVGVGYVLAGRGWFPPAVRGLLPRLVTNVALPPFLMCTILRSFGREDLWHMLQGTLLPLLAMVLMYALAYAVGRAAGVERRHFGLFCACVSNPNTIFIGIPVNMALFGEEAVPYVLLYYFASTSFFWTVGNYAISRDERAPGAAAPLPEADGHPGARRRKALVSAPVFGFIAGISLALLHVELPGFLLEAARLVGSLTTPLALIYIGVTLHEMDLRHLRVTRDMALALTGRMAVSPLLVWVLLPLFGLPPLMGKVFVMQASLPVLMQVAILSGYYNTDPEFGSLMVSLSTLACAVTIPVYMLLLSL